MSYVSPITQRLQAERFRQHLPKKCSICGRKTNTFPKWDIKRWACKPCLKDYMAFRRLFKVEHGYFPSINDFRDERL